MNSSFGKFRLRFDGANFGPFRLSSVFFGVLILGLSVVMAGTAAAKNGPGSLPASVLSAHTVYVENQTTDAQLQTSIYAELMKWGRFQIADTPQKADLILRISNGNFVKFVSGDEPTPVADAKSATPAPQAQDESVPPGFTRITVVDPKSGNALWSGQKKTAGSPASWHLLDGFREAIEKAHNGK